MQNPAGQYPSQPYSTSIESGFPGYGHQQQATNYSNFQLYSNPYGDQNFHTQFPNFTQQQQPQQPQQYQQPQHQQFGQMMQGGPFSTPPMFAPSTPYPTQPKQLNQQSNNGQSFQFSSILNQFKNTSGSYDVPKMMSTAGQMMNTVNQVGGLFKQIGFFFK
ncbi:YppG family protein [Bacillus sp. JJ664]